MDQASHAPVLGYSTDEHALEDSPLTLSEYKRFDRLLEHMPIPLWAVDARSPGETFEKLKAEGITDIVPYLEANPHLVDFACDTVMVSRVNKAAVRLLGGTSDAPFLRSVRYLFEATPAAAIRVMTAHFEGRRTHVEELRINAFDGRVVDVLFLVTFPQPPENLDVTFIVMQEITDRLAAEAQLRQLQADLAHAARVATLGELATSIAHEVKQPIGAIVMNGETGLRWLAHEPPNLPRVKLLIERMIESASQATEIINRIQSMASKQVPVWTNLSLNDVVDMALRFVRHDAQEKHVAIRPRLGIGLPDVSGDRIQLQQVAVNLLVNAIQAMDHIPVDADREILVTTQMLDDDRIELSVEDSGPGIEAEHLDHLFQGFFTTKATGMGMGLTICETIIHTHEGEIVATNRPGGGAIFRCILPVLEMEP